MFRLIGLCILLSAAVIFLGVKIYLMKRSAGEIREAFEDRLRTDTNTLIDISSRDREMRLLADSINKQLKILRREHLRFRQGDTELKNAVTNISHDLRTPLTAICGYLDILKREEKSSEAERCLDIIADRTELMKQLTEELFRYSVILSTDSSGETEEVFVNQVLEESIAGFYAALSERGITPKIDITGQKIVKTLNRASLSRVFANLLNNAVKYSGGDLEITLSDSGVITFANSAEGLDSLQAERLFDRFYTVEAARNSTGLGLAIARTLTEQMGGTISAEYRDGKLIIKIDPMGIKL
ncbi:MAG: HAMP domain-containing histidine kinase [Oscillospiraceae bacterium]|nr:HAMP domain-containing histidine kinase [Oscillospiraceae bacterium]